MRVGFEPTRYNNRWINFVYLLLWVSRLQENQVKTADYLKPLPALFLMYFSLYIQATIYLFKVNNGNSRKYMKSVQS